MGHGSPGKTPFVAAVQCAAAGRPIAMRMDEVAWFRKTALVAWAQRHLAPGTAVVTDGLKCFPGVTDADCTHTAIPSGGGAPDLGHPFFTGVNMLGNVKNALHVTCHALRQRTCSTICPSIAIGSIVASTWLPWCLASSSPAARTPPLSYRLPASDA